jgi:RHS repeat-associated protein
MGYATYTPNAKLPQVLMRVRTGATNYYIYGAGLLYEITETATTTNTLTYHYDVRGSTIALTDNNGNVTDRVQYSAYGMTLLRGGTNDTPFLYNGRYGVMTDPNGLLYMRARYYNPYICRFINADPSGFTGGLNWYCYADGNPVSNVDPFGLDAWRQLMGGARGLGGGLEALAGYGLATAGAGLSATGAGAILGVPLVGLGVVVGAHGLDTAQAGARQAWSGNQVDSFTSGDLQMLGMSRNAANLTDAGISVAGSLGAGAATPLLRASTIAATDPLAQGLSSSQILSQWESGSVALNNADFWGMGGTFTSPLYKAALMDTGAYPLTTTGWGGFVQSLRLAPTGLTPLGYLGAGVGGGTLGAVGWTGNAIQPSSSGK